jgi:hypothetical protein
MIGDTANRNRLTAERDTLRANCTVHIAFQVTVQ